MKRARRWSPARFASLLAKDGRPRGKIAATIATAAGTATSAQDLRNWSDGTVPSVNTFLAIAHVLGVPPVDLTD